MVGVIAIKKVVAKMKKVEYNNTEKMYHMDMSIVNSCRKGGLDYGNKYI